MQDNRKSKHMWFVLSIAMVLVCASLPQAIVHGVSETRPTGDAQAADSKTFNAQLLERVRRATPAKTPAWVNAIPGRLADILIEKHLYKQGEVWGLAKRNPDSEYPYDEMGSATFIGLVKEYNLFDRVGPLDEAARLKALRFWQGWQDPKTGRFRDPRDPKREVNEKYVVGLIGSLGAKPLYPWTTTGMDKQVETRVFLERTRSDPDWARGGWGVGSHTGFMAVEIFDAVNNGRTELIPDLELGVQQILSHQDAGDGLWGPPSAELMRRIGGTLKVIGRLYFKMGMTVPHTRELADALILHSKNRDWFTQGVDSCVPRNVAEVTAYCIEVSDYRGDELLGVLETLAEDYRSWVLPDGRLLIDRGDAASVGLQYTTLYGLGIVGAYLHWEDCRLPNPLAGNARGRGYRYQIHLTDGAKVKVVDTAASAHASADEADRLLAPFADEPVRIDGVFDEAAWALAPLTIAFVNNRNGEVVRFGTTGQVFHGPDAVYVGVTCDEPQAGPLVVRSSDQADVSIAGDDSVEVFLDPGRTRSRYYQVIASAAGVAVAGFNGDYEVPKDVQLATLRTETAWAIEMRIPYSTLGCRPYAGDEWGLNLYRTRPGRSRNEGGAQLAWRPTKSGYRKPHLFGTLLFGGRAVPADVPTKQQENGTRQRLLDEIARTVGGQSHWRPSDMNAEQAAVRATRLAELLPRACRLEEAVLVARAKPITNEPVFPWTVPTRESLDPAIEAAACTDEFEPASITLFATRDLKGVGLEMEPLVNFDGRTLEPSAVDVRQVLCWYQAGWANVFRDARTLVPELLIKDASLIDVDPETRENRLRFSGLPTDAAAMKPFDLPAFEAKQIWLTFRPPAATPPGVYRGRLHVRTADGVLAAMPVRLTVHPFTLEPPVLRYSLYYRLRPSQTEDPGAAMKRMAAELRNQVEHGIGMPCTYVGSEPLRPGGPSMETLEDLTRIYRELGLRNHPLILVTTAIGRQSTPEQLDHTRAMVRRLTEWARRRGYSDVYIHCIDEGGPDTLKAERPAMQAVHEAGGKVFVACGADYFDAAGDLLDMPVISGTLRPDLGRKVRKLGHQIFSYANPQAGVEAPETYRRNYGLKLWAAGYSGAFNYEYQGHETKKAYDDFFEEHYRNHTMAYPAHGRPIDTRQWEGWREGVDDVRYVSTLRKAIDHAAAAGRGPSRVEAARKWLATITGDEDLDAVRRQAVAHILALRQ